MQRSRHRQIRTRSWRWHTVWHWAHEEAACRSLLQRQLPTSPAWCKSTMPRSACKRPSPGEGVGGWASPFGPMHSAGAPQMCADTLALVAWSLAKATPQAVRAHARSTGAIAPFPFPRHLTHTSLPRSLLANAIKTASRTLFVCGTAGELGRGPEPRSERSQGADSGFFQQRLGQLGLGLLGNLDPIFPNGAFRDPRSCLQLLTACPRAVRWQGLIPQASSPALTCGRAAACC